MNVLAQELSVEFQKLKKDFLRVPSSLYSRKLLDGAGGKVSVVDLIAYQIGWGNLLLEWYHAGLAGKTLQMPGEGFSTWDYVGIARHFYQKYQYKSKEEQLAEFEHIVAKILAFVEKEASQGNLDELGVWRWCTLKSGKQWPLSKWVRVNTIAPYKKARVLLRKLLK